MIKRRRFLQSLAALATVPFLGTVKAAKAVKVPVAKGVQPWLIDPITKTIKWNGPENGSATVLELHRFLQESWDEERYGFDMFSRSPSDRVTDQILYLRDGYHIEDGDHLFDGTIIQGEGDEEEIFYGVVNFSTTGPVAMDLYQNGVWVASNEGDNPDPDRSITNRFMIKGHNQKRDKLVAVCRETGKEFSINGLSCGNNCLALGP